MSGSRFLRAAAPFAAALITIVLMTVVAGQVAYRQRSFAMGVAT